MRVRWIVTGVSVACAAFAFAQSAAPPQNDAVVDSMFQCGDSRVDALVDDDGLVLTVDAATYSLTSVQSGSGARYEGDSPNGKVVFWSKGREATLKIGKHAEVKCRQLADDEIDSDEVDD